MDKKESDLIGRVLPMVAAWGIAKLLETEPLKASVRSVDKGVDHSRRKAGEALSEALGEARQNAMDNGIWLAAGLVAVAVGIGLIVRATRP